MTDFAWISRLKWSMKYTFDLDPISVERVEVLESKLRDQQEELAKLREEMKFHQAGSFILLEASTEVDSLELRWDKVQSDDFAMDGQDGIVKICRPGAYDIQAFVQSTQNCYKQGTQLLKNGSYLHSQFGIYAAGNYCATPFGLATYLNQGDELTVICDSEVVFSSLSIVRVGDCFKQIFIFFWMSK